MSSANAPRGRPRDRPEVSLAAGERRPAPTWMLLAVFCLMGITLRASMGSIPPLLDDIGAELAISSTVQALLTSVTVVFVGLSAPAGQRLAARIGSEQATTAIMLVLGGGLLLRLGATTLWVFLISCVVTGAGMGGASALMPSLIAHHLPQARGFALGLYSTGLAVGIAIAAAIALPTASSLGGWRPSLALWGVVTAAIAALWAGLARRLRATSPVAQPSRVGTDHRLPWSSATARWVAWLSMLCMVIGFSGVAWLVPMYVELGVPPARAAGYLVLFQLIQLVGMLTLPWISDYVTDRRPLLLLTFGCTVAGLSFLVLAPISFAVAAVSLFGMGAGGCFALSLIVLTDATATQADGARLNAMVMLVGYPIGASAPILLGFLHDVTGSFVPGFVVVLAITMVGTATIPAFRPGRTLTSRVRARSGSPRTPDRCLPVHRRMSDEAPLGTEGARAGVQRVSTEPSRWACELAGLQRARCRGRWWWSPRANRQTTRPARRR